MKNPILIWLLVILATANNSAAQAGLVSSAPTNFTLNISMGHSIVKVGAKVAIQIALTNTSDKPIGLHAEIEDYGFMVDVKTESDGAAVNTDRGREWKKNNGTRQETSGPMLLLKPGETQRSSLAISDLYDLSRPGKYSVQVCRGTVKSNTMVVTVVP
jgi:hypothetical protein